MRQNDSAFIFESFKKMDILLSPYQVSQFLSYCSLLLARNEVMNLTAITDFEDIVIKHFADSVLISKVIDFREVHSLIDVGSGAGFPGIPLKIVFPDLDVLLLDSLNKRVQFLNDALSQLHLTHISAVHARAEDAGRSPAFRDHFDLCVSRAVAPLPVLSEYCLPFVRRSGFFAAYKSSEIHDELEASRHAVHLLGGILSSPQELFLPGTDIRRSFVLIGKEKDTPSKYPRKAGIPQKSPLS